MKISVIYPEKGVHPYDRNWMFFVFEKLKEKHDIIYNRCEKDCDIILGMSIGVVKKIQQITSFYPDIPLITYNWDMHPMLEPEVGHWSKNGWKELMEKSIDIWTQTYYHAKMAEEMTGLRHFVMPICGLDFEFERKRKSTGDYALMASRRVPYKGFDMFENGCKRAQIKYISRHPEYGNRDDYVRDLVHCKVVVIASEEEANTPMSGYEGAFCKKPLLLSDIPPHREEWEDSAIYFKNKDINDFREKLIEVFEGKHDDIGQRAYDRAMNMFRVEDFARRMDDRICEVLS